MRKLILSVFFLIGVVMTSETTFAKQFIDVPKNKEYYEAIDYLSGKGIIEGYSDGTFRPHARVTRAQAAKMLTETMYRHQLPFRQQETEPFYFSDVAVDDWYYDYATVLKSTLIMSGYDDGTYRGYDTLHRAQLAKMMFVAFQVDFMLHNEPAFEDVAREHWSYPYVQTLSEYGILQGSEGLFKPSNPVTRSQFALILYRTLQWLEWTDYKMEGQLTINHPNLQFNLVKQEQLKLYERYIPLEESKRKFNKLPSLEAPYQLGQLTTDYANEARNAMYYVRGLAGMYNDIKIQPKYMEEAQAAALVLALNDEGLSHEPRRPQKMSNDLYQKGFRGAGSSNIALGYKSIPSSIMYGYMMDADLENRRDVGHRRWILCPCLDEVGFGQVTTMNRSNPRTYSAVKVYDESKEKLNMYAELPYIAWPTEHAFPLDLFIPIEEEYTLPWSVSLSKLTYQLPKKQNVKVELTRLRDKKTLTFTQAQKNGFFTIDNSKFGEAGPTIIFQPRVKDLYPVMRDEAFNVKITGLKYHSGKPAIIEYTTHIYLN